MQFVSCFDTNWLTHSNRAQIHVEHLAPNFYLLKSSLSRRRKCTAPFRPNSLFAFFKTDRAFHGVDPIADTDIERNMLLYNIYVNEVLRVAPPARGFRWPWARG